VFSDFVNKLFITLQTSFLTKCAQSIAEVAKKVRRLGGNGEVASVPLEQFLEKKIYAE